MKKALLTLTLSLFIGVAAAQHINPQPHYITTGNASVTLTNGVDIKSSKKLPSTLIDELKKVVNENKNGVKLSIGTATDRHMQRFTKEVDLAQKSGAYYLDVKSDGITLLGYDNRGVYYGIQTLKQLVDNNQLTEITIADAPDIEFRGVVEGFYGNPWSHQKRLRLIEFLGANKMNTYIYGPKDDPYHSSLSNPQFSKDNIKGGWRLPYPAAQAQLIKELVERSKANYVDFVWAIHPGQDIKWNDADFATIISKFESMYALGVRSFALFFDDISGEGTDPHKQAALLNGINREFIATKSDVTPLIMCPTEYNKSWANPAADGYLPTLGKELDPQIHIMWTGDRVCDNITTQTLKWIQSRINRPAYIWWNYPVNDYAKSAMPQGPSYGLTNEASSRNMAGFTSNPMEHCEASRIALYGIGDYSWNVKAYSPLGAWERAIEAVVPQQAEAYRVFAIHSSDMGLNWHRFRRDESWETTIINPMDFDQADFDTLRAEFQRLGSASTTIINGGIEPLLLDEVAPWLVQSEKLALRGTSAMDMISQLNGGDILAAWGSYLGASMSNKELKEYNAHKVGGLKLQPFIDTTRALYADKIYENLSGEKLSKSHLSQGDATIFTNIDQVKAAEVLRVDNKISIHPPQEVISVEGGGGYIGIDLGVVTGIAEISTQLGTIKSPAIEYSQDGASWSSDKPLSARFVRYINGGSEAVDFRLRRFEVNIDPSGGDVSAMLDKDLNTGFTLGASGATVEIPSLSVEAILFSDGDDVVVNGRAIKAFERVAIAEGSTQLIFSGSGVVREVIFVQ